MYNVQPRQHTSENISIERMMNVRWIGYGIKILVIHTYLASIRYPDISSMKINWQTQSKNKEKKMFWHRT